MHNMVAIDSDKTLVRDIASHAVIAISPDKVNEYRRRKALAEQKVSELSRQQNQIDEMKTDINQIKSMLQALMQR